MIFFLVLGVEEFAIKMIKERIRKTFRETIDSGKSK